MLEKQLFNLHFIILAPGSYDVEKVENVVHQSSPAFSFGVKYKEHQTENLPGKTLIKIKTLFYFATNVCISYYFKPVLVFILEVLRNIHEAVNFLFQLLAHMT